jgi:uncharacterized protein (DUF2267 family)
MIVEPSAPLAPLHAPVQIGGFAMAVDTVNVFEHTIEVTHIWLHDLMDRLGWQDKRQAYLAMRAVLHTLRDRISVDDASHLAAQLPMLIRGFYYEGYHPAGKPVSDRSKADFLARVADECSAESRNDGRVTRAVFQVLSSHIASGEADKIKNLLPKDIRELWNPTPTASRS